MSDVSPVIIANSLEEQPSSMDGAAFGAMEGAGALPDLVSNWADDESVALQIREDVIPLVEWCRDQRSAMEDEWDAVRRMIQLEHDAGRRYVGRSNAYVPAFSRALNTLVSAVSRGLFPSDEYMDVMVRGVQDPEAAKPVKEYLQYEFEKVARLRMALKPFLREFFSFGTAVGKVWYEPRELAKRKVGKFSFDKLFGPQAQYTEDYGCEGLRFSARSIYNWFGFPVTATDSRELTMCAEDIAVSDAFIAKMKRINEWVNVDQMSRSDNGTELDRKRQDAMGTLQDATNSLDSVPGALGERTVVTEIWTSIRLPRKALVQREDPDEAVPCKIVVAGQTILAVRRNPFWHQSHPYLLGRMDVTPGSLYGRGSGHYARSLQYLVNDFTNQLNDNGTYALNPIIKLNPGLLAAPPPPLKPGGVWQMNDIQQGMAFDRPPIEQIQYGLQLASFYQSQLQDLVGAPPALQGASGKGAAKTATGAQILQSNARNPIQDIVEDLEQDILIPLMKMAWMLGQQYRREEVMDTIAGAPIKISREQLYGDFSFRWLASSQASNQQQRAQQAISLLQVIAPMVPLLQMQGKMVDPTPLLKRIYSDGFGFRGFDQFVRDMPMQPGMPGMPPEMGGSPEDAMGGNVRSATEQAAGGQPAEMQQGEGEDFANVRDEADMMAAMMGGQG